MCYKVVDPWGVSNPLGALDGVCVPDAMGEPTDEGRALQLFGEGDELHLVQVGCQAIPVEPLEGFFESGDSGSGGGIGGCGYGVDCAVVNIYGEVVV